MERKLNEQWIEVIDGQEHMVKAIEPTDLCQGCLFNGNSGGCWWSCFDDECEMGSRFIIKDLGILNDDGCLPSPWGGYPKIVRVGREDFCTYKVRFYLKNEVVYGFTLIEVTGNTRQQAIDAWNRRV